MEYLFGRPDFADAARAQQNCFLLTNGLGGYCSLSAAFSLGILVDIPTAILLSFVAALCACGAAGVPGGSLMLIPLACSLFGIDNSTAMQVVAVGFIIGVLQDSTETALNSSSDALFTASACLRAKRLEEEAARKAAGKA